MINEGIKPSLIEYTQIKVEQYDNKDIIVVDIQSGPNKPYYLSDKGLKSSGVYLRHGSSSVQASFEVIRKMIFEHSGLKFEEMVSKNQNLSFKYMESNFKDNKYERLDDVKKLFSDTISVKALTIWFALVAILGGIINFL